MIACLLVTYVTPRCCAPFLLFVIGPYTIWALGRWAMVGLARCLIRLPEEGKTLIKLSVNCGHRIHCRLVRLGYLAFTQATRVQIPAMEYFF